MIARPGQTAFLLRHYPKAVAGLPEEINKIKPREGSPLEIVPTFEGNSVKLVALRDGKPAPGIEFHSSTDGVETVSVTNGTKDSDPVSFGFNQSGGNLFTISTITKTPGEWNGQKYAEIREFASLAFDWPLVAKGPTPRPFPCSRTPSPPALSGTISPASRPMSPDRWTALLLPGR